MHKSEKEQFPFNFVTFDTVGLLLKLFTRFILISSFCHVINLNCMLTCTLACFLEFPKVKWEAELPPSLDSRDKLNLCF